MWLQLLGQLLGVAIIFGKAAECGYNIWRRLLSVPTTFGAGCHVQLQPSVKDPRLQPRPVSFEGAWCGYKL